MRKFVQGDSRLMNYSEHEADVLTVLRHIERHFRVCSGKVITVGYGLNRELR